MKGPVVSNKDPLAFISSQDIEELKRVAQAHPSGQARINLHHAMTDAVHEMVIATTRHCLFAPHRHVDKSESFQVIEGHFHLLIFNDDGSVKHRVLMTPFGQGGVGLNRISVDAWHTLVPITDMVVYKETTSGPFIPDSAIKAPFCPGEGDGLAAFLAAAVGEQPS